MIMMMSNSYWSKLNYPYTNKENHHNFPQFYTSKNYTNDDVTAHISPRLTTTTFLSKLNSEPQIKTRSNSYILCPFFSCYITLSLTLSSFALLLTFAFTFLLIWEW